MNLEKGIVEMNILVLDDEKEIADLQTKIATESKKEVDKNRQIDLVNRSITKSTSLSMLQSKRKKIERTCLQRFI